MAAVLSMSVYYFQQEVFPEPDIHLMQKLHKEIGIHNTGGEPDVFSTQDVFKMQVAVQYSDTQLGLKSL